MRIRLFGNAHCELARHDLIQVNNKPGAIEI